MGNKKNKEALFAEGITETFNTEKCIRIQQEVGIALGEIIAKYTDEGDL